jgi:anaerobic magnesium-protoporphyrin IX monomethyl ester cyclase
MKVMLLYPKWITHYGIFAYFAKRKSIWPPLNLTYLAAVTEKEGYEVRIIDGQAEDMSQSKMVEHTLAFNPDIIGITSATPFYHIATDLAKGLKEANSKIPVVIGGAHITILKEEAFSPCFDYAFIGESEKSWPMFLDRYQNGKDISSVKGMLFRDNGQVKFTGAVEPINDLDSVPFPARRLLKMDKYQLGTLQGTKNFTSIMFSRGCPFQCIFCCREAVGRRVRKRSVRSLVDEIKSVVSEFNIRHFYFADDNLTLDQRYILEMCDLIDSEKLSITFEGSTRANLVDEELIARLARAGLIRLSFGLETTDPEIRRIIKKEVPLESYAAAYKLTNKYGIETLNSVMLGLPGETHETVKKTLHYLRHARGVHQASFSIATPYPGTELYEMAKKGEHGLRLMTEDFSEFRRNGSAVMSVGDLTPADLIKLQNDAFLSVYLAPWRLRPMMKRMGIIGVLLTYLRLIRSLRDILFYQALRLKRVFSGRHRTHEA